MLTPAQLSHLIAAFTRVYPNPAEPWDMTPVGEETRRKFLKMGVIYLHEDGCYRATDIGARWLMRILATPDPIEWDHLAPAVAKPEEEST